MHESAKMQKGEKGNMLSNNDAESVYSADDPSCNDSDASDLQKTNTSDTRSRSDITDVESVQDHKSDTDESCTEQSSVSVHKGIWSDTPDANASDKSLTNKDDNKDQDKSLSDDVTEDHLEAQEDEESRQPADSPSLSHTNGTAAAASASEEPPKKRPNIPTGLEDLGPQYDLPWISQRIGAAAKTGDRCAHCRQRAINCFDYFFGPYCVLAGVHSIKVDEYIPSAAHIARLYTDAYQHSVHFYSFLVTRCFNEATITEHTPPRCMLQGSFAYLLQLRSRAIEIEYNRSDVQFNVVRSVMMLGKEHHTEVEDNEKKRKEEE